jgi:hypothetical protein
MYKRVNVVVLCTFSCLHKLLVNALPLVVFLISCEDHANEPIRSPIDRIKSIHTVLIVCLLCSCYVLRLFGETNLELEFILLEALKKYILIHFNSLALLGIILLHILMGILSIHRILIILLLLHLVLPSALFCHHFGS